MQPLNPFLAAFFKSPLPAQCLPAQGHVLLVPSTDVLLTSRETEAPPGASLADSVATEEFLASHVLRIPDPAKPAGAVAAGGKESTPNLREMRGKAKQYNTINGRNVVIKDNVIYTNKGFKVLASANLLGDSMFYSDTLEPRGWLIYHISRPLVGSWEEIKIIPAVLVEGTRKAMALQQNGASPDTEPSESAMVPKKKEIKSFHDLLNHFPVIARQMQSGLERLFQEKARSNSMSQLQASPNGSGSQRVVEPFYAEDDEEVLRVSLETAVTNAIDLFQNVDKQQLSLLGATTELTGPVVERLIERYVTENVHNMLFPRLAALKRPEDLELEAKIRQMDFVDVSQLGIVIEGGHRGKQALISRLARAIDEFKKITNAGSPPEMMDILLSTMKSVTQLGDTPPMPGNHSISSSSEKGILNMNADTLVSLLLFILIRAQVKHLQARFLYMRHFIFVDDVDSGEMGKQEDVDSATDDIFAVRKIKRVTMDMRSLSSSSEISFHSRTASIGTIGSGIEGDTSIERLSQTQDSFGESVLMMAVQNERPETLKYLLDLKSYYTPSIVLSDSNNEGTTLLSAAVQLGHEPLINVLLKFMADEPTITEEHMRAYFAKQDVWGRTVAHYLFHAPYLIVDYGRMMPWTQKDKNGQTPLFAICRSYDHALYHTMVQQALEIAKDCQGDGQPLHLDDHIDGKGNTLLHIVSDAQLCLRILQKCDADVNAINDRKFTPLMVASKYGRFDVVRAFFSDARVDITAKELRGLTAVDLAKDDDVRNKIDDLVLFAAPPGTDSRTTAVVRSYFVEDASVRFVLKSGAPVDKHSYAVTTCRRSLTDFEHLAKLLAMENPASWIPSFAVLRSPFQIPVKPSRAVLKELQVRMDWFLRILLAHPTFATHEMLWEFFLVPDLQPDMMEQRSKLKAETRAEKVRDELEPLEDVREVEQFVDHARENVRGVNHSTKSVARRTNIVGNSAFALQSTIDAILSALARPPRLINQINVSRRTVERNYSSLSRSTRWPLGLLDDTRQRLNEEREERMRAGQAEVNNLSRELRYTQQTVAMELAGWQDLHERMGRRAIRELARGMVVVEKMRLEGMKRALRKLSEVRVDAGTLSDDLEAPAGLDIRVGSGVANDAAGAYAGLNAPIALAGLEIQADRKANADPRAPTTSAGTSGDKKDKSRAHAHT
ncbi:putative vps9 domain [Diaporthe ampelina]|uniref:Putative vps9 domain n=1 Tax=Diaporthe ampelina TaxID=1214573 RepID=A0A0G2IGQ6_9PEZI|nr:putative vps9 domain [Diaporthe ampelina]